MPDDLLPTLLLTAFGIVGLALLYRRYATPSTTPSDDAPLRLSGQGTETTRAVDFSTGRYRLHYKFPPDTPTAVTLLDTTTGDRDLLGLLRGSGETSFTTAAPGRFALHVEAAHATRWTLTITPLGLPSQRGNLTTTDDEPHLS